jgi:hypothetical protein
MNNKEGVTNKMVHKIVELRSQEDKYHHTRKHLQIASCHNNDENIAIKINSIIIDLDYKLGSIRRRIELYESELLKDNLEAAL